MTRAWEILDGGRVLAGIPVDDDGTVHVGQYGRGRELRRVAVPAALVSDGRLSAIPGEGRALLLIRDQSGYRGGWHVGELCPCAEVVAVGGGSALRQCADCGEWTELDLPAGAPMPPHERRNLRLDSGDYVRRETHPMATARVLAEGHCAQGDAGRMGGGPEYLLSVPLGWVAHLWRSGRLYGGAPLLRVEVSEAGEVAVSDVRHDPVSVLA